MVMVQPSSSVMLKVTFNEVTVVVLVELLELVEDRELLVLEDVWDEVLVAVVDTLVDVRLLLLELVLLSVLVDVCVVMTCASVTSKPSTATSMAASTKATSIDSCTTVDDSVTSSAVISVSIGATTRKLIFSPVAVNCRVPSLRNAPCWR